MACARIEQFGTQRGVILRHRGDAGLHWDLLLAGPSCPTFALTPGPRGWTWRAQPLHRRRYLTFRGALTKNRGRVEQVWSGILRCWRLPGGLRLILDSATLELHSGGVVLPRTAPHCPPWLR